MTYFFKIRFSKTSFGALLKICYCNKVLKCNLVLKILFFSNFEFPCVLVLCRNKIHLVNISFVCNVTCNKDLPFFNIPNIFSFNHFEKNLKEKEFKRVTENDIFSEFSNFNEQL